ncbi:Conserved_hypothetical protein [Hexamita inflata]|uniref:Uncharacterized protein n=1 Tax=Hexamita inflata TaxID=28002 RepID=A0AA86RAH8_9EUKA|nr:Conserved hypothetical protein [Hexamita inflata]
MALQNKQNEVESWMLKEAEELKLDDAAMQIVKQYKQTESEIFYTLQYQKQQFPVLPLREEDLFLSPFEMQLEKCQAQKYEIDWPELPESDEEHDELEDENIDLPLDQMTNTQSQRPTTNTDVQQPNEQQEEQEENELNLTNTTTLNIFIQNRNPRELHLQQQPLALFDMWRSAMDQQFSWVQRRDFE